MTFRREPRGPVQRRRYLFTVSAMTSLCLRHALAGMPVPIVTPG